MTSDSSPLPGEAPAERSSFPARAVGVLFNPVSAFDEIVARPDSLGPLLVLIAASIAVAETMLAKIGLANIILHSLQQSGRARHMTPDQLNQVVGNSSAIVGVMTHVGAVVGPPIFMAVTAGVGLLILNGIFGARAGFNSVFSVTCYAALPVVIGDLMAIALILFGDPNHFNPQAPIPTNPAFFLDPAATSRPLYALASSLDLLTFWFLGLLAVGLSRLSRGRVKARNIFLAYFVVWLALALGKAGLAIVSP